jgi:uncharacterized protein (DUF2141 family)
MPLFKTRLVPLLLLFAAMAVRAGEVQVELSGLQDAEGDLYITVYDSEDSWLGEERVMVQKVVIEEARTDGVVFSVLELPPGEYALTIYHDTNGSGDLDTNFIGIPKEPVAMSNNAKAKFGPPKYDDAKFTLGDEPLVQRMSMAEI